MSAELPATVGANDGPRAWWVAKVGSPADGCAWTNKPTALDLATMRATADCEVEVIELGDVAAERERCAKVCEELKWQGAAGAYALQWAANEIRGIPGYEQDARAREETDGRQRVD